MVRMLRLMDMKLDRGKWIEEPQLIDTIKIMKDRNRKLYKLYVEAYEHIFGEKYDGK